MAKRQSPRIVVPLDGSPVAEQVIPYAEALRGEAGELIFLEVVFPSGPERSLLGGIEISVEDLMERKREAAGQRLRQTAERWRNVLGREPRIETRAGDAARAILSVAADEEAELIALASSGKGALMRLALGSVVDQVTRTSTLPVLIVHPDPDQNDVPSRVALERIAVPLDGSELAEEALPVAAELAKQIDASILLINVVEPFIPYAFAGTAASPASPDLYTQIADELKDEAVQTLERGRKSLPDRKLQVETQVIEGPIAGSLAAAVKTGDLIVMTSHGRTGFRRFLLGSVAEKLIKSRAAPVVLVPSSDRVAGTANH